MESLDQCASCPSGVIKYEVVECIRKICSSLQSWSQDRNFPEELVARVNSLYPNLETSDYLGKGRFQKYLLRKLVDFSIDGWVGCRESIKLKEVIFSIQFSNFCASRYSNFVNFVH